MKRIIAMILCAVMLIAAVPRASAEASDVDKEMRSLANRIYARCQQTAQQESFHGYCGKFVSHQLYNLKINRWATSNDGNKLFDYYSALEKTTGGYYITSYGIEDYDLLDALNHITRNGTRDVYNVLVGFQWTNTEAGAKYGHAVLIYGIVDGMVYFAESYPIYLNGAHAEGALVKCSIEQFAESYGKWTVYEGIIVFGTGEYADGCEATGTNLVVQARFDTVLRSQPQLLGQDDCVKLRDIPQGERLRVTEILKNSQNDSFYRVAHGETVGYVSAAAVSPVQASPQDLKAEDLIIPEQVGAGQAAQLSGYVSEAFGQVSGLDVNLLDSEGTLVAREALENEGFWVSMEEVNESLHLDLLEEGMYTLQMYATIRAEDAKEQVRYTRICVAQKSLQVGDQRMSPQLPEQLPFDDPLPENGWFYRGGWRLYREGQPVTGWVKDCGVWYYLNQSGVALTGWQSMEGKWYCFTETGAMLQNCQVTAEDGLFQLDGNGVATKIK